MEPNGVPAQGQLQQTNQAPPQQQVPPPHQQPATPRVEYRPVDPNTGQITTPQNQQPAQSQPQITDEMMATRLRSDMAASFNIPAEQLPNNYQELLRIQAGAIAAVRNRQAEERNASMPKPQETVAQTQTQQSPLAEKQLPPGWQNMVSRDQNGQWQPNSPYHMEIAKDANYNESVRQRRQEAVNAGQLLPEQQKSIEQMVNERMAVEREQLRGEAFLNANRKELYELNPDGSVKQNYDPLTGNSVDVRTPLGIEMKKQAEYLKNRGARFDSAIDLANMALEMARVTLNAQKAQQPPAQVQNQPQPYNDLQDLLDGHKRSGSNGATTYNTAPNQFKDFKSEMRSALQNFPDNASGMELAKALGFGF